ncbi:MAG TPA: CPBP family intramembrane glutamic endopeptidase [Vicinamibacteria bacterium]
MSAPRASWRESRWLAVAELLLVVGLVIADSRRLVPFSKTPFYFALGWASLRLRGPGWRGVGLTLPPRWPRALGLGTAAGILLEILSAFVVEPGLARLFGKTADLSDFRPLVGNAVLLLVVLAANWTLAAFGEELVYRGYLMNRVAGLAGGTTPAWTTSLVVVSALFGWAHVDQGVTGQVQAAFDGLMLGLLYLAARRNLLVPIVSHGVSNSLAFVLIYLGRYPGL